MDPDLSALCKSFLRHLKAEGKSPATIRLYGQSVRFYATWLAEQGETPTLGNLSRPLVRDWLGELNERNAPGTVKTRYRGLYRFCKWLVSEQEIDASPMDGLSPPALPAAPVPVLTDDELKALLNACRGKAFADVRDTAIVRLLLDCGIRVSELCALGIENVDLDNEYAFVKGKGSKVRPVYFAARTVAALDKYERARRRHRWASLPQFFLTQRGAMSPDGVRERMKIRGAQAGIDDLHPHRFRHTFAHDFLMSGGQERDLKRLAGWSSDVMLERYGASAADERAKQAARRLGRGDRV